MRAYRTEIRRSISRSKGRFIALVLIVALGAGFYAGLRSAAPDMRRTVDQYLKDANMMDVQLLSTLGFSEDDVDYAAGVEGVEAVMPTYYTDAMTKVDEKDTTIRIHALPKGGAEDTSPEAMNRPVLKEGRWPQNSGECVLNLGKNYREAIPLGSQIKLESCTGGLEDTLKSDTYTVVGFVDSAYYLTFTVGTTTIGNGQLDHYMFVPESEFVSEAYSTLFLKVKDADTVSTFTARYDDIVGKVTDQLDADKAERETNRRAELIEEGQKTLDDAQTEFDEQKAEAEEKLADAKKQLDDGAAEIAANESKLYDAQAQLTSGESQLQAGKNAYASGLADYESGVKTLTEKKQELEAGKQKLEENRGQLTQAQTLVDSLPQLQAGVQQAQSVVDGYPSLKAQLAQGIASLQAGIKQLEASLPAGQEEALRGQYADLLSKKAQVQAGLSALEDPLAQAAAAVAAAQKAIDDLPAGSTPPQALLDALNQAQAALSGLQAKQAELQTQLGQIDAGLAQIKPALDGFDQLADLRKQLTSAQDSLTQLENGYTQAQAQLPQLTALLKQAGDLSATLPGMKAEFEAAEKQISEGEAAFPAAEQQLSGAKAQLDAAAQEIASNEALLASSRTQLQDGWAQINEAKTTLQDGQKEYDDSKKEVDEKLRDAEEKLLDGKAKLQEIETPTWYVLDRHQNYGFANFESDADRLEALSAVFPTLFFLVAALVALTTMTRMVEEERILMGTYFSLGYSKRAIAGKYLLYAGLASVLGCVIGIPIGMYGLPPICWNSYRLMYVAPPAILEFNILFSAIGLLASAGVTLAATAFAVASSLRETPATLMLPRAPKAGKRIFLERIPFLWKRMKFTNKVTARNLFRYKRRLIMTVVGIAGCTALLVTGFGIKDSISGILVNQFEKLYEYSAVSKLKTETVSDGARRVLDDPAYTDGWMVHYEHSVDLTSQNGSTLSVNLFVPEKAEDLKSFVNLRGRTSHADVPFGKDSVVLTEKAAEKLGIPVGGTVKLQNSKGQEVSFTVTGITENYIYHYLYIDPALYTAVTGDDPVYDQLCIKVAAEDTAGENAFSDALMKEPGVSTVTYLKDTTQAFQQMVDSLNNIIVLLTFCAGLLAFIVLYNLTNINVTERQRELATIKVLGFYDREVSSYIYRETSWLTVLGCGVGLLLGIVMHLFVISTVEVDMMMFGRSIAPLSFVYSAALTILFSVIVDLVMNRKLKRIDMVESLKSVD